MNHPEDTINKELVNFLNRFEWRYGENRAPIKFPAKVKTTNQQERYHCQIELDEAGKAILEYRASSVKELSKKIKQDLNRRFLINHPDSENE